MRYVQNVMNDMYRMSEMYKSFTGAYQKLPIYVAARSIYIPEAHAEYLTNAQ